MFQNLQWKFTCGVLKTFQIHGYDASLCNFVLSNGACCIQVLKWDENMARLSKMTPIFGGLYGQLDMKWVKFKFYRFLWNRAANLMNLYSNKLTTYRISQLQFFPSIFTTPLHQRAHYFGVTMFSLTCSKSNLKVICSKHWYTSIVFQSNFLSHSIPVLKRSEEMFQARFCSVVLS